MGVSDSSVLWSERLKTLDISLSDAKKLLFPTLFRGDSTTLARLIHEVCLLLISRKSLNLQDYHQKRLALSFYRVFLSLSPQTREKSQEIDARTAIPLQMAINQKLFTQMFEKWWKNPQTREELAIPSRLALEIITNASFVNANPLEIGTRLIIYGGQPLDPAAASKPNSLQIIFGRKTRDIAENAVNIAFSGEEAYISRKQCSIGYENSQFSFFFQDHSRKSLSSGFLLGCKQRCALKNSLVFEIGLTQRFYVDFLQPSLARNQEDLFEDGGETLFIREIPEESEEKAAKLLTNSQKKSEKLEESANFSRKTPFIRLKCIAGCLKNQVFSLKLEDFRESWTIGRDSESFVRIPESCVARNCARIAFDKEIGWVIESIGETREDLLEENKENTAKLPKKGSEIVILAKTYEELRDGKDSKKLILRENMMINIAETVFSVNFD